jgi:hypothetical protein
MRYLLFFIFGFTITTIIYGIYCLLLLSKAVLSIASSAVKGIHCDKAMYIYSTIKDYINLHAKYSSIATTVYRVLLQSDKELNGQANGREDSLQ